MQEEIQAAERIINLIVNFFVNCSFQVVGALITLLAGFIIARSAAPFLLRLFERKEFDITLSKFIAGLAKGTVLALQSSWRLGNLALPSRLLSLHSRPWFSVQVSRSKVLLPITGQVL